MNQLYEWGKSSLKIFNIRKFLIDLLTVKKVCGSWNQKLYIGEYSGIYSLKFKNSGIYNLRFAPS
jgi:hypothetical protein